jgi:hypothetical protein
MYSEFVLFIKNGHVAAKCGSANNKIVKKIKLVSYWGKEYKIVI